MQVRSIAECSKGHSAILSTIIKLPFVFKTFVLSIFEWPLKAGFTVVVSWKSYIKTYISCLCYSYFILLFLLLKYKGSNFCSVLLLKTSVTLIYVTNDNLNYIMAM